MLVSLEYLQTQITKRNPRVTSLWTRQRVFSKNLITLNPTTKIKPKSPVSSRILSKNSLNLECQWRTRFKLLIGLSRRWSRGIHLYQSPRCLLLIKLWISNHHKMRSSSSSQRNESMMRPSITSRKQKHHKLCKSSQNCLTYWPSVKSWTLWSSQSLMLRSI